MTDKGEVAIITDKLIADTSAKRKRGMAGGYLVDVHFLVIKHIFVFLRAHMFMLTSQ